MSSHSSSEVEQPIGAPPRRSAWRALPQRRVSAVDHLRPQRWNWSLVVSPVDNAVERQARQPLTRVQLVGLRFFWLDGLFSAISENFYLNFIPLFALAYGATNGQVGWVMALANLAGALALFPGARQAGRARRPKPIILWPGVGFARLALLLLALMPLVVINPMAAFVGIVALNALRAFMSNFANPAWTSMVADLVPDVMRGRYFSTRNLAMGTAALLVAPLAGYVIQTGNQLPGFPQGGYQAAFFLAFCFGVIGTLSFARIPEPEAVRQGGYVHQRGDLRRGLRENPEFVGLLASAFVWNLALQVAGPFFNVYLVTELGGTAATVGMVASVSSIFALVGQAVFGRLFDRRGALWMQTVTGLGIAFLPLAWTLITQPWHVGVINIFGGFLWAGFNLANFNLLLDLTPDQQRPRAVALYQTMVFGSAFLGPVLGGYVADLAGFKAIFALSGTGRMAAMLIFIWFSARPARRHGKGLPTVPRD